MPDGIVKPSNGLPGTDGIAPVLPTVAVVTVAPVSSLTSVTAVTSVDPLYRAAAIGGVVRGVNPVPLIETAMVPIVPATMLGEPTLITGVARMLRVVLAELPAASVIVTTSAVEVSVDGTTNPRVAAASKLPVEPDETVVPTGITVGGVTLVSYQLVCVPLMLRVSTELPAKPIPETVTAEPGLTAAKVFSFGETVNVADAYAPVEP